MSRALREMQQVLFAAVSGEGPEIPAAWFAGNPHRAALGLSVHAATVGDARERALLDIYPRTERLLNGEWRPYARSFLRQLGATRLALQDLGKGFPAFLRAEALDEPAEVASVEWAIWEAARAVDAPPLEWDPICRADVLAMRVGLHPAAFLCRAPRRLDLFDLGQAEGDLLLVARPFEYVTLTPAPALAAVLAELFRRPRGVGEAVTAAIKKTGASEESVAKVFCRLVSSGALVERPGTER